MCRNTMIRNAVGSLLLLGTLVLDRRLLAVEVRSPDISSGNNATRIPFYAFPDETARVQEVHSSADFLGVIPNGGVITKLRFYNDPSSFGFVLGPLRSIQFNLSTVPRGPDQLSSTFAENVGHNDTIVFAGSLPFQASTEVPLSTPFVYRPQDGHLLVDIRVYVPLVSPANFSSDAHIASGDTISMVFAFDVNALVGNITTGGLLTSFEITPIPEPSVVWFGALFIAVGWASRFVSG